jgi:hypothetical protein
MTAQEARARAEQILVELTAKLGKPVAVWDGQLGRAGIEDHGEVWAVAWNSVAYLESGSIFDQVLSGPIVIPKDGSDYFILGTESASTAELLDRRTVARNKRAQVPETHP